MTKLLVATKKLLEGLTHWANHNYTEEQVSDIFVQLATQFNLATQAFHDAGINTSDLAHIPDDLRNCLETALGEDPSPDSLDLYLPRIKEIIINLLQGLRIKQNLYREQQEARTAHSQRPGPSPVAGSSRQNSGTTSSARARINRAQSRSPDPSGNRGRTSPAPRNQTYNASTAAMPTPTLSVTSARDEPSHADTMASLRKSDAITRRASTRRHSHRFSTLVEQNTPPPMVPRRQHPVSDSSLRTPYNAYAMSQGSAPSSPILSSSSLAPPGQVPEPLPTPPNLTLPPPPPPPPQPSDSFLALPTPAYDQPPTAPEQSTTGSNGMDSDIAPSPSETLTPTPTPPVLPTSEDPSSQPTADGVTAKEQEQTQEVTIAVPEETGLTLFLQVGKSVKKSKFEGELTHSGLRMLFMEKFQYNPGQDDFPTIYVKDPNTNIHYELESMEDVRQNAFLSLNVDDLENVQRKMDQGFAVLTKELNEIKKSYESMEQAHQKSVAAAAAAAAANSQLARAGSLRKSNSSQQLRSVVQKVITKNIASSSLASSTPSTPTSATTSTAPLIPLTPQSSKVTAAELKNQWEEIQTLRQDLGILRQIYTEFQTDTKDMLNNATGYASQLKKQANDAPQPARLFIETGKVNLDQKSEGLTNKIEELQDVVEDMKTSVTQRRGRPSESSLTFAEKQCGDIGTGIDELSDYIQTLRPTWKKTWETELQTIVKEQMFLKEQEALLEDLKEDRNSLVQTLSNIVKLLELQDREGPAGKVKDFVFQPAVMDDDMEGLKNVLLEEVRMVEPDSDKRLKAMAQMEKLRHIELTNRLDEFEHELTSFVGENKLRKTGGALEVERQRQQRDSDNLKAMFGSAMQG